MHLVADNDGDGLVTRIDPAPISGETKELVTRDIIDDLGHRFHPLYWPAEDSSEVIASALTQFLADRLGGYEPTIEAVMDAIATQTAGRGRPTPPEAA